MVPAALTSRTSTQVPNDQPHTVDVPVVPYEWMAQVAFECGLFPTLEDAIGDGSVNAYFVQRSTPFGQLVDSDGKGIETVTKAALRARLGEWSNFHDNPEASLFVQRPLTDLRGMPDVHPVDIFTSIESPMVQIMLEWIEQGAQPPAAISFVEDIYPLFEQHGCVACHSSARARPATTPLTRCASATDDILNSKLVSFPLTDPPGEPDTHPVNAFATTDHPDMQLIIQWIAQGANFENDCSHDACSQGEALVPGCTPCVTSVCNDDPFCCSSNWDAACVNAANNTPECGC